MKVPYPIKPPSQSKYKNKKVTICGIQFDSQMEAKRYFELTYLLRAGEIRNLKRQVKYELIPKQGKLRAVTYVADFVYEEKANGTWRKVVEDTKGMRTEVYKIKKKLMKYIHGIDILET